MRNTLILAALLAAAPFAASAEGLSYSYVEGGWNRTEINVNDDSDDIDGGYIRGSWKIAEPVYAPPAISVPPRITTSAAASRSKAHWSRPPWVSATARK